MRPTWGEFFKGMAWCSSGPDLPAPGLMGI